MTEGFPEMTAEKIAISEQRQVNRSELRFEHSIASAISEVQNSEVSPQFVIDTLERHLENLRSAEESNK